MGKSVMRHGSVLTEITAGIVIISVLAAFLLPHLKDTVGHSKAARTVRHLTSLRVYEDVVAAQEAK